MKNPTKFMLIVCVVPIASMAFAHCEIPCGIYGDKQRVEMIEEHITTVEKSVKMIKQLSGEKPVNYNQLVRWIDNKEAHAAKIQDIVFQYFMTQRIKPADAENADARKKYIKELETLHRLAIEAMKSKQSLDLGHIKKMRKLIDSFSGSYFAMPEAKENKKVSMK